MPTRNVVITERHAALIEECVKSGEYQNASEVLREGLRLVEERRAQYAAKLEALRAAAQVGIDDMEAGRYTVLETSEELDAHFEMLTEKAIAEAEAEVTAEEKRHA